MKILTNGEKKELCIGVPKKYVTTNIKIYDSKLTSTFFLVYCIIDRWRTFQPISNSCYASYYKVSVLNILEDIGQPYDCDKHRLPAITDEIIHVFEFLENEGMIKLVKGDYHNPYKQFIIYVEDTFISKDFVSLPVKALDFVLESKSTIKKGNLLYVLLYALSPIVREKTINPVTCDIEYIYHQVYSESNKQTSKKIGLSDKTIGNCLSILSGQEQDNKPLIVHKTSGYFNSHLGGIPDIYTSNSVGWEKRIRYELKYYENKRNKKDKQ
jgi:hypothetical protein